MIPTTGRDVHKRQVDSFSRPSASLPVSPCPERLSVERREGGGKAAALPPYGPSGSPRAAARCSPEGGQGCAGYVWPARNARRVPEDRQGSLELIRRRSLLLVILDVLGPFLWRSTLVRVVVVRRQRLSPGLDSVGHRPKWQLVLDMLDELDQWGLRASGAGRRCRLVGAENPYTGGVASVWFAACRGRDPVWRQIAKASSSNATATRRVAGSSTASS
jgi:hypothetical protein